jgi:hypothetical protein
MTALPSATTATAAAATEGDVKNFLIALHDFCEGLLGATGVPADARAALGVAPLTLANIVAALGYTPANLANSASDHNHSGVYMDYTQGRTAFASAGTWMDDGVRYMRLVRINGGYIDVRTSM